MNFKCDNDCFNCKFEDCIINDYDILEIDTCSYELDRFIKKSIPKEDRLIVCNNRKLEKKEVDKRIKKLRDQKMFLYAFNLYKKG